MFIKPEILASKLQVCYGQSQLHMDNLASGKYTASDDKPP